MTFAWAAVASTGRLRLLSSAILLLTMTNRVVAFRPAVSMAKTFTSHSKRRGRNLTVLDVISSVISTPYQRYPPFLEPHCTSWAATSARFFMESTRHLLSPRKQETATSILAANTLVGVTVAVDTLTRTKIHRMKVGDLRDALIQRGVDDASTRIKNRAQLVTLLLEQLNPTRTIQIPHRAISRPARHSSVPEFPVAQTHVAQTHLPIKAVLEYATEDDLPQPIESPTLPEQENTSTDVHRSTELELDPTKEYVLRIKGLSDSVSKGTGIGMVLLDKADGAIVWRARKYYPTSRSLYEAEYTALVVALRCGLKRFGLRNLVVQMEQSVIVNQLDGLYTVEKQSLRHMHTEAVKFKQELAAVGRLEFEHVSRLVNADSAELALRALETRVSKNMDDMVEADPSTASEAQSLLTMDPMVESTCTAATSSGSEPTSAQSPPPVTHVIDPSLTYLLQFDGGARGNTKGAAGAGMVIYDPAGREVWCGWKFLSAATSNNQAEYQALQLGLECARSLGIEKIRVEGDSELVIKQLTGVYQVKNEALRVLWQQTKEEMREFKSCDLKHIFRENNKRADWLANNGTFCRGHDIISFLLRFCASHLALALVLSTHSHGPAIVIWLCGRTAIACYLTNEGATLAPFITFPQYSVDFINASAIVNMFSV
jgi:ribonuclease HI